MTDIHGGRITARQLRLAGIDTIFGVVAGPMIEVMAGAQEEGLRVIGCRHEENAGFMAQAWGYVKQRPGVLVVGSGPALTNAVTPMHVATESGMPLVVLGGSVAGPTRGIGGFQECDQIAFARPGCKWTGQVDSAERIAEWVHVAVGKAGAGRPGAVYLDYPGHLPSRLVPEDQVRLRPQPDVAPPAPDANALDRAADALARAERPLVMIGKGAGWSGAGEVLARLVGRGIPYVASPMGRGVVPDDDPHFVNGARSAALAGADAILMVGGRFNWIFGFGRAPRYAADAHIMQIDVSAEEAFGGADVDQHIVADARLAVAGLSDALEGRTLACNTSGWLTSLREVATKNEAGLAEATANDDRPINPYRLVREVRDWLPRDATVVSEGETIMGIARVLLPSHVERSVFNAGTTGCMGTGLPYAIGAKLARPEAPAVAVLGDYAFGSAAIALETAARHDIPVVVVVANNQGIAGHMIQDFMLPKGAPPIAALSDAAYEKMAEMVDGHAERVDDPAGIRPALDRALASGRVAVVHVAIDPKARRLSGGNYLQ